MTSSASPAPTGATPAGSPENHVSAELLGILRDDLNVDVSRVTPDARLVDNVGLDSVAFAVGMVAIEERLGVTLTEEELLSCETVGDLQAAIAAEPRETRDE